MFTTLNNSENILNNIESQSTTTLKEFRLIFQELQGLDFARHVSFRCLGSNIVTEGNKATKCSVGKSQRSSKMITVTGSKEADCIPDVRAQFISVILLPPMEQFCFILSGGLGRLKYDYSTYLKDG